MKVLAVFAVCVASTLAASYGGYSSETRALPKVELKSYSAPAVRVASYEAPVLKSSYETPLLKKIVPITNYALDNDHYGTYKLDFASADGHRMAEEGSLKMVPHPEADGEVNIKKGVYSWTAPDGQTFTTSWFADETGFHASGDHLPTPPPVPVEIAKMLAETRSSGYGSETRSSGYGYEETRAEVPKYAIRTEPYQAVRSSKY